jgi:hypothetical protein
MLKALDVAASYGAENHRERREDDPKRQNQKRYLEPYESADFPKHEFDTRPPGRGNGIADELDAALHQPLRPGEKRRVVVEGNGQQDPRQDYCERAEGVEPYVIPESRTIELFCHRLNAYAGRTPVKRTLTAVLPSAPLASETL